MVFNEIIKKLFPPSKFFCELSKDVFTEVGEDGFMHVLGVQKFENVNWICKGKPPPHRGKLNYSPARPASPSPHPPYIEGVCLPLPPSHLCLHLPPSPTPDSSSPASLPTSSSASAAQPSWQKLVSAARVIIARRAEQTKEQLNKNNQKPPPFLPLQPWQQQ